MTTETYILPAHWASSLINNDNSGIEDSDIQELNNWYDETKPGYCIGCSDEPYFSRYNDAYILACDVLEYTFSK